MKTTNSTQWCNLYSTASKYNICIKQSRYHHLLLLGSGIFINLLLISYDTYAYQFVLVTVVLTITLLSFLIARKNYGRLITLRFTLDELSVCSFESSFKNTVVSTDNKRESFQLLASSRYSFIGCWLQMASLSNQALPDTLPNAINKRRKKKRLFIYRDSLSAEDFSRLSQAIRKLGS